MMTFFDMAVFVVMFWARRLAAVLFLTLCAVMPSMLLVLLSKANWFSGVGCWALDEVGVGLKESRVELSDEAAEELMDLNLLAAFSRPGTIERLAPAPAAPETDIIDMREVMKEDERPRKYDPIPV